MLFRDRTTSAQPIRVISYDVLQYMRYSYIHTHTNPISHEALDIGLITVKRRETTVHCIGNITPTQQILDATERIT